MNSLSTGQRWLVFGAGFVIGCVILSFIHENRRAARADRVESNVPRILHVYADLGVPLEGPFVLASSNPVIDLSESNYREVIIGSRDGSERFRIEEWFDGQLGVDALLIRWRASEADVVGVTLDEDKGDVTQVVASISSKGYQVLRRERDSGDLLVQLPDAEIGSVPAAIKSIGDLAGVTVVYPIELEDSGRLR